MCTTETWHTPGGARRFMHHHLSAFPLCVKRNREKLKTASGVAAFQPRHPADMTRTNRQAASCRHDEGKPSNSSATRLFFTLAQGVRPSPPPGYDVHPRRQATAADGASKALTLGSGGAASAGGGGVNRVALGRLSRIY